MCFWLQASIARIETPALLQVDAVRELAVGDGFASVFPRSGGGGAPKRRYQDSYQIVNWGDYF